MTTRTSSISIDILSKDAQQASYPNAQTFIKASLPEQRRYIAQSLAPTEAQAFADAAKTYSEDYAKAEERRQEAEALIDKAEEDLATIPDDKEAERKAMSEQIGTLRQDAERYAGFKAHFRDALYKLCTDALRDIAAAQALAERQRIEAAAGGGTIKGLTEFGIDTDDLDLDIKEESKMAADASPIRQEIEQLFASRPGFVTDDLINVLDDNLNGSELASDAEVSAGYIPLKHHFHYFAGTAASITRNPGAIGQKLTAGDDRGRIPASFLANLALNCHMLREGRNLSEQQFLLAFLKVLIAYSGVFEPDTRRRCVFIDEYTVHNRRPPGFLDSAAQMATMKEKPNIREQEVLIKRNIHRLIGTAVHVFRTRNHHYTDSSMQFVQRTWSAVWNGSPPDINMQEEDLFRSSIHCFGMKPLVDYCLRGFAIDVMPAALKIRRTAARAGTAPVRLVDAAFKCMRAEPFYPMVLAAFRDHIDAVDQHVQDLIVWGDSAHVNHWFVCGVSPRAAYNEAIAEPLMPIAAAYIKSLGPRSTLKMQIALNKRISNHASLVDAFAIKFAAFRTNVFETSDLPTLLASYRQSVTGAPAPAAAASTTAAPVVGDGSAPAATA